MTLPYERTRAVIKCEEFLQQLALNADLPQNIRDRAHHLLRHYPSAAQIRAIGRLEAFLANDVVLDVELLRRVTVQRQLIFSSSTSSD